MSHHLRRHRGATATATAAVAALVLVAAACGGSELVLEDPGAPPGATPGATSEAPRGATPGATAVPTPVPTPTPVADPPGRAPRDPDLVLEVGDRIVVQTAAEQLLTIRPDGTNAVPLTNPAEGTANRQPSWAPDGSRLAWTATGADATAEVRSARFDGTEWLQFPAGADPFALSFDVSATRIAYLQSSTAGFDLALADLATGAVRVLDQGSPYWFAWSPDGDAVLINASGIRLDRVPLDGPVVVLEDLPALFQSPAWLPGPLSLVFADEADGEPTLVVTGRDGEGRRPLVSYEGYLQFAVSPASGFIAMQAIDEAQAPQVQVITASFQTEPPPFQEDVVDPIEQDALYVLPIFGGEPFSITDSPSLAWFWSPDGSTLAWVQKVAATAEDTTDCSSADPAVRAGTIATAYQWSFWRSGTLTFGPSFYPSWELRCTYLPFFDQYGKSTTFFSPDGTQFVYAGASEPGEPSQVWVTGTEGFETTGVVVAGDGTFAAWSPTTAGSGATSPA